MKEPKQYVTNKELHIEMLVSLAQGFLTRKAKDSIVRICKGVNSKFYYKDNDDRHDTLQESYYQCFKNWYLYNPDKTHNAFSFITEIAKRGHAKGWNKLIKSREAVSLSTDGTDGTKI
jgi:hypothetical protein